MGEMVVDFQVQAQLAPVDTQQFKLTDLGNAERLIARHGENLRYCAPWKKWLRWDDKRWQIDAIHTVSRLANETVRALYKEASDLSKHAAQCDHEPTRLELADRARLLLKHAKSSEAASRLQAMIELARAMQPITPDELDSDPWLFNCANGMLDLRTGQLSPHLRPTLLTKLSSVAYDPNAECPTWEAFLRKTLNEDAELIWFLQKAVGYSMTGDLREQCLFFLHGSGENGKSTFLNTIDALLGDYAETADFGTFIHKESESIRNDLAALRGSRFVLAVEADEGRRLAEGLIKKITGGDEIKARFLYAEYFSFTPTFKLWFAANHKPVIRGADHAMWRRIRLIPFAVRIAPEERDPTLGAKLLAELPGILRWAVFGCQAWLAEGLNPPPQVLAATAEYRSEMDVVGEFLSECCMVGEGLTVSVSTLYDRYVEWSGKSKPMGQNGLSSRLKEHGFTNEKSTVTQRRTWQGLGLRP